jgi:hypothetical protein
VADLDVAHAFAHGVDRAGDVDAGDVGKRDREGVAHVATTDTGVDGVERRGGNADSRLPGAGGGTFHVLVEQDVGIAVLVETHCLHCEPRFRLDG